MRSQRERGVDWEGRAMMSVKCSTASCGFREAERRGEIYLNGMGCGAAYTCLGVGRLGNLQQIFEELEEEVELQDVSIDSTSVKAH